MQFKQSLALREEELLDLERPRSPGKNVCSSYAGRPAVQRRTNALLVQCKRVPIADLNAGMASAVRPDLEPAWTQNEAAAGVANANDALPYADIIQKAFGRHDVSHVRAAVGGPAAQSSKAIGAKAYATGDRVGFAGPPDLHTAAHEAAHVVQQRAGVQLAGGVGSAGDAYEQHADRVADRVVAGESAEAVLDEMAGAGGGAQTSAVQRSEEAPQNEPAPAAPSRTDQLSQRVGKQVDDGGGYTFVLGGDLGFEIVGAPAAHQSALGKSIEAGSSNPDMAEAWNMLADKIIAENPIAAPVQSETPSAEEGSLVDDLFGAVTGVVETVTDTVSSIIGGLGGLMERVFPVEEAPATDAPSQEPETQEPQSELDQLMSQETLTVEEVARARELIAERPAEEQPALFELLQEKNEYHSQRDNESTTDNANQDNMCNLTSLAMCLEYLGIGNPGSLNGTEYPQFEDYLEALRIDMDLGYRGGGYVLRDLALKMGVQDFVEVTGTGNYSRDQWEAWHAEHICAGYSMLLSVGDHIVRWQGITDQGLVIDDPYGRIKLQPSTDVNHRWSYDEEDMNEKGEADNKGEDNVWLWADVEAHAMKWMFAFGV